MSLTDTRIRSAKPSEKPYKLTDEGGLYLEVRPTGARLWRYRYRLGGKENLFALGAYPDVTLAEAREERDRARKLVKRGVHPAHQRKVDRLRAAYENANTFQAVAREWLDLGKAHWRPRTYRQRERLLEADVYPKVGALPMRQVTAAHAHAIVQTIAKRAPQMAIVARQCISGISRLAIATARADTDIAYPLRNSVRLRPTQHKPPLRVREIPAFFQALETFPGHASTKGAIRMLWWTLVRSVEIIGARWTEFDLDHATWTIPASRMKMGQPHTAPLPEQAVEMLRALRTAYPHSDFLLPNRKSPRRPASQTLLAKAFVSMGYEGKFTPHGVRVTGRTILGEQGHPRDVLERQLAHAERKEVRAYDHSDRLEARRIVMQGWADYLDGLAAGGNVVNIKAGTA